MAKINGEGNFDSALEVQNSLVYNSENKGIDSKFKINIESDPDSIGNSIQFDQGGKSPATYNAILELFKVGEKSGENIRNIQLGSSNNLIEIFLDINGSLTISTKPQTISISKDEISKKINTKLKRLQKAIISDTMSKDINTGFFIPSENILDLLKQQSGGAEISLTENNIININFENGQEQTEKDIRKIYERIILDNIFPTLNPKKIEEPILQEEI